MVIDKHWLSVEEANEGMGMVQLYPGPLMVDFSAYVGYKLRGVIGAVLATIGFILPTFILMSILSVFYFSVGNLPWVHPIFLGLEALVVGIVLNVTLDMGAHNIGNRTQAIIMFLAFAALLFKVNSVVILLVALVLGALLIRPTSGKNIPDHTSTSNVMPFSFRKWAGIGVVVILIIVWSLSHGVSNPM